MLSAAATSLAALAAAPAASANSAVDVFISPSVTAVSIFAASGKVNDLQVVLHEKSITFTDPGDLIDEAFTECSGGGTNTVECTLAEPIDQTTVSARDLDDSIRVDTDSSAFVRVIGGDGSDEIVLATAPGTAASSNLLGDDGGLEGDGNDTITGGDNFDSIRGGGGTDVLLGRAGTDQMLPDQGDGDRADGGPGDDQALWTVGEGTGEVLDGGPGTDTLIIATGPLLAPAPGTFPASVVVDLPASRVTQTSGGTASASAAFEFFEGSGSVFTVTGTDGHNQLTTGAADDLVDPRGGPDHVDTGQGADRILTRDGFADRVQCGADADTVEADQFDDLFDCETVNVAQVLPAGVELDAPLCTVSGVRRTLRRKRFLRGLGPEVECNEPAGLEARLTVPVRRRGGRLVTVRAGQLVLAEQAHPLAAGARRLTLSVPRRLRGALGRRFAATLTVVARDQFGNRGTVTRVVRVRR